jgi:tetratricopeptide (TPR) repeat protein
MAQDKLKEAEVRFRSAIDHFKALKKKSPGSADACFNLATCLYQMGRFEDSLLFWKDAGAIYRLTMGDASPKAIEAYRGRVSSLLHLWRLDEAEGLADGVLGFSRKVYGEDGAKTGDAYLLMSDLRNRQGRHAQAEAMDRKALAIHAAKFGEESKEVAFAANDLGFTLLQQERLVEAEAQLRRSLVIRAKIKSLAKDTATTLDNLGDVLRQEGRLAEAEEASRRSLAIRLESLGPDHFEISRSHHNLAAILDDQGHHAEAEAEARVALNISLKASGENSPETATSLDNFAQILKAQGRLLDAAPFAARSLAIERRALGDRHPRTILKRQNLAALLVDAHHYKEAETLYREALAAAEGAGMRDSILGACLGNLGVNLRAQGREAEAEPLLRRALNLYRGSLGDEHPATATAWANLAVVMDQLGKHAEAIFAWENAAKAETAGRSRLGITGSDRSQRSVPSPLPDLAVALARAGRFRDAWERWEQWLARGLLDDASARDARPLTEAERRREAELAAALQALDEAIDGRRAGLPRTDDLDAKRNAARRDLVAFANDLDRRYGPAVGASLGLERIQAALPEGAALIGWISGGDSPWACIVKKSGDPLWVALKMDDRRIPLVLRPGVIPPDERRDPNTLERPWREAAVATRSRWLDPLSPQLVGISHLIVLPSPSLAGLPIETIESVGEGAKNSRLISYAPSGSLLAFLSRDRVPGRTPRLLAIGDPKGHGKSMELPGSGAEARAVAALFGADASTVLLGEAATESTLDRMAKGDSLRGYTHIHFDTHGRADRLRASRSMLLLSTEPAGNAFDGVLTSGQVAATWRLDADLVTLSACETGLGRPGGGEGYLGFTQAFFAAGARTMVVSLWEADTRATRLLMPRFYENLLGSRDGRTAPMPKAKALNEAKQWLRELDNESAAKLLGEPRPPQTTKPFSHPSTWAAFVLIGDPT